MNACVLAVGSLKEKWQKDGAGEYLKRLTRYGKYETAEVPDEPEPAKPSKALNDMVMEKEGKALLSRIRPNDKVVALCINGKQLSSEELASETQKWEQEGKRVGNRLTSLYPQDTPKTRQQQNAGDIEKPLSCN